MLVIVPGMCDRVCVTQKVPRLHCMVISSPARYHNLTKNRVASGLQYKECI